MSAFHENTVIISARNHTGLTVCYRKNFTANEPRGTLRIAAEGTFAVYVNGRHIQTRTVVSFDFCKFYDEIGIGHALTAGTNCLAIECTGAIIAEVLQDGHCLCGSDESFVCRENTAYHPATLGAREQSTLGHEEWYDSRLALQGWMNPDFDDSQWEHAVSAEAVKQWSGYTKYRASLLSNTPLYGKQVYASLVCQRRPGIKMCLWPVTESAPGSIYYPYQVYVTQLFCEQDTHLWIGSQNAAPRISIDGKPYTLCQEQPLAKGMHLLCLSYPGSCELLIDCPHGSFSAAAFCGEDCRFAATAFFGTALKYPWHEVGEDIARSIPELAQMHDCRSAEELCRRFAFKPVTIRRESARTDMVFQTLYRPRGGECPPGLCGEEEVAPVDIPSPVHDARHLLSAKGTFCEIRNDSDYDAAFILDLGKEFCGHVSFALDAQEGQTLDIQCFEVIDDLGIYLLPNYNGLRYVARGGYQAYRSLSRYGGRYLLVAVRGKGVMRIHDLHIDETVYPVDQKGTFSCSDELLNRIYEMCLDTTRLCMLDTYVDCPGHEESVWTGDAQITARNNLIHFGACDLDQQDIALVAQTVSEEFVKKYAHTDKRYSAGQFLSAAVVETFDDIRPMSWLPIWSFQWIQHMWDHYLYTGNLADLAENYGYVKQNLANADRLINHRGLFDMPGAWNLIEWACNDLSPYGEVTASSIMLVNACRIAARMAEILGYADESRVYAQKAEALCDAINRWCWSDERQAYVDTVRDDTAYADYCAYCRGEGTPPLTKDAYLSCSRVSEQTNTLALLFDCVPPERLTPVLAIAERVKDGYYRCSAPAARTVGAPGEGETRDGIVMIGSPFFLYFSLGALWKYHKTAQALCVIRNVWGGMLARGTNTCWEGLDNGTKRYVRSICHAWSASPSIYLSEEVLGIKPTAPGYREFTVQPDLGDLQWAKGSVVTPYGNIHVSVQKAADGSLTITCQAPDECRRV